MARDEIAGYYRQLLGREYDQGGLDSWVNAVNAGHMTLGEVAGAIGRSDEANRKRASKNQALQAQATQLSQSNAALQGLQGQISGFQSQISDYRNQVSGLQNQYNDAMGQVSTWQTKAGEFETSARDWEDQFSAKSQEYEAARDEAERYRNEAVGQQLRALKSGATTGGSNSTTQQGGLASGKTQVTAGDDKGIDIDKDIKAESGALSGKGPVVQKINARVVDRKAPARPNQGLASGSTQSYYASRFS